MSNNKKRDNYSLVFYILILIAVYKNIIINNNIIENSIDYYLTIVIKTKINIERDYLNLAYIAS